MPGSPPGPIDVASILRRIADGLAAAGVPESRLDAEVLTAHVLGAERGMLPARSADVMAPEAVARLEALAARRAGGRVPVHYLTGRREFWSLEFRVDARVMIPRPETEGLVEALLAFARAERAGGRACVLACDVATGSGCVAIAAAVSLPGLRVVATDREAGALEVARSNVEAHGTGDRVALAAGDLLEPFRPAPLFDAVVSNPPYIAEGEVAGLMPEVRDHEPAAALACGPTGLEATGRIVAAAAARLRPGGLLAVELAAGRHEASRALLDGGPWEDVAVANDAQGIPRILTARRAKR